MISQGGLTREVGLQEFLPPGFTDLSALIQVLREETRWLASRLSQTDTLDLR